MESNKKFLKVGDTIMFKPDKSGLEYDLENGKVYTVEIDDWNGGIQFKTAPDLQLPEKIYSTRDENKFVDKILNYYNASTSGTTGVMLSGLKGSGKTVMIKNIAVKSNLPIILIDKGFRPKHLTTLFNKLNEVEVCVLFDEIDKIGEDYDDDYLLKIMDGANSCGKKLMLFTCNDESNINEYLKDRCSRIRYWKKFDEISASLIDSILTDKLVDKDEVKPLTDFILNNFRCLSFDNICSFVDEVNNNPNDTFEELFKDMNLSSK